ncbi:TPA: hypothetical protein ACXDAY_002263 [Clostridium botulinum]|uniref:hypothetical protein n=2 Tax=Clostridium botulinum TaxID=1491 RepID=UPI000467E464|nr:hypothetical protein [Clostridium botulinum]APH20883.1 hypothetical protein NPD1_4107 [Clostridium botulinum]APQ71347.1 hypothetical protein RSJ8_4064 [Clostridium botulinum]APR02378.1 hypothetical protein RSJ2_3916 [Clostridium botulinum]AUN01448.1 hypothetical protein RSJ19_00255 [Clostridium botulinum]MBN3359175.1 hypothetical protein [Clostridium botulinum]
MKNKIRFIHDNQIKTGYIKTNLNKFKKEFILVEKGKNRYRIPIENLITTENELEINKKLLKHQIDNYISKYNLTIQWVNDTLKVSSILDEWFIEPSKNNLLILQHINKKNKDAKGKFHKQGIFYNYFSALRHIAEHDKTKLGIDFSNKSA